MILSFGISFGVTAHKAIDKPSNELPNFVSPHLFNNLSKRLKTPLRTEENIITWSDAIAKGLPILKVGSESMSYNDFMKKGGIDSVKIEEGGVDCIRYRISKAKDSISIGEEFELTITAEYIDNIPYTWQNKDCGDFCIKVFLPEGFVQTGGDYRDFEGFSLRPDGLKRIERKIKGYFESKPQNSCFMLTKGAKYYDPQFLLEIKQNYCFVIHDKTNINYFENNRIKLSTDEKEKIFIEVVNTQNSIGITNSVQTFTSKNYTIIVSKSVLCNGNHILKFSVKNNLAKSIKVKCYAHVIINGSYEGCSCLISKNCTTIGYNVGGTYDLIASEEKVFFDGVVANGGEGTHFDTGIWDDTANDFVSVLETGAQWGCSKTFAKIDLNTQASITPQNQSIVSGTVIRLFGGCSNYGLFGKWSDNFNNDLGSGTLIDSGTGSFIDVSPGSTTVYKVYCYNTADGYTCTTAYAYSTVTVKTDPCITESNVTFTLNNSTGSPYFANNGESLNFVLDKTNIPASYAITWYRKTGNGAWENINYLTTDFLSKYSYNYSSYDGTQYFKVEITKNGCTTIIKQIEVQYKNCAVVAEFWVNTTSYKGSSGTAYVGSTINFSATSLPNATYVWTGPNFGPLNQREGSISNVTAANSGIYTVTASNVAGCGVITATMYVDVVCFPIDITTSVVENDIFVGNSGIMTVGVGSKVVLSVTAPSGATFGWSGPSAAITGGNYNAQTINIPYMTQSMSGGYTVVVSKDGCTATKSFSIDPICSALNNVNAYTNSPNYEVKTGEKLNLWVDKGGPNYTHTFYGPTHNFTWVGQFAGVENVDDSYSGVYNVVIGYAGCSETINRQVDVRIFKCNIGVDTSNVVCNAATGSITSFKVIAQNYTDPRTVSFKLEIRQTDLQGNPYFTNVDSYPSWVQAVPNVTPKQYTFSNLPSGTYRIWTKEQNLSENGGSARICESSAKTFTIKCDPCSYVKIDVSPTDKIIPAPTIALITLKANYYNTPPAPISVNSLSTFNWTGPNGFSKTTQSVTTQIPGNYIVNYTAAYNNSYTKTCTASKVIPMDNCAVPISVVGYSTSCKDGINYVELKTEGDFSNMEFSSDMDTWSRFPKVALAGSVNAGYKIFGRSIYFQTCIKELITITKTCDCASQGNMTMKLPTMDCSLGSNTLKVGADFSSGGSIEYKVQKKDGSFESAWTNTDIFNNLTSGSYYVYARKQGASTCYIQSMVDVTAKLPESPVSYPCDINKNLSIGETASSISVKTQKSWAGNALRLDGLKDFGETTPLTEFNGSAFTFETWAFPDQNASIALYSTAEISSGVINPTNQRFLAQGKTNGSRAFISLSVGDNGINLIEETTAPNSRKVILSKPINITNWVHIAVTYQSGTYTLIVNGANNGTATSNNAVNGIDPPSLIGGSTDSFFKGKIDETRWWNITRTEADIKAKMSVTLVAPFASGLTRYYRFDQTSSSTIINAVSNSNNITLKGGECNAFVDNTIAQTGLELYPQFTWSNGATGREIFITTPTVTTCYTVTMISPSGASCSTQICVPVENCNDINVTVSPSATVQENAGVRPLLSANITNESVKPTVTVDFETSLQLTGNNIVQIGDYRWLDNTFTYEFWAKPSTATTELNNFGDPNASTNRHIIRAGSTSDGNKTGFALTLGSNGLVLFENGPNFMSLKTKYYANFANSWTHVAIVYEDGKPRIYINGELVYSSNAQPSRRVIGSAEMGWVNGTGFDGLIDEFRIWASARTAQEIKDNFDKTILATTPNVGYWRFNRSNVGKVIDTPNKIFKDESIYERPMTSNNNTAIVTTTTSSGTVKVNPKITWWLEKKNPTTGEITEEQVGVGNQYKIPLDLIKQGTYNYTVKFVKNDNTICKRTKTITVTANTEPVSCFEILSDGNYNLISGNAGTNLKQTLNGVTTDRIWKRTYRASDNSYFVYSAFNGLAWQKNGVGGADPITLVDGDPNNAAHRWKFEDIGNNRLHIRSLGSNSQVLCTQNPNCGDQCTIIAGYADWNWSQRNFKVQEVTCPVIDDVENCVAEGRISYQRWDNVGGTTIASLNAVINTTPSNEDYVTSLEKQSWGADNYGTRIRGYVCPPLTGYYTFWVAGDDNVELWLSTDDKLDGRKRIAYHNEWSGTRDYTKFYTQESTPIPLKKGKKYYIEVLHKESGGGDGVSVRWRTPYGEIMEPIPGQYLAPYQACKAFAVKSTPEDEEILVDTKITMEVTKPIDPLTNLPIITDKIYTWSVYQGGANANLIDANGNAITTLDGYTAWAKPSDEGEVIYKVVDKADATCYQFIKKKVKAVLCGCKDCGDDGKLIATQNPSVTAGFSTTGYNYVVSNSYIDAGDGAPVIQSISYFDGIGRPLQSIVRGTGITGEDIVQPYVYDEFGRTKKSYLPYPEAGTGGNFVENAKDKSTDKYFAVYGDRNSIAEVEYEKSPINRVLRQGSIGAGWEVNGTKATEFTYRLNTAADAVKILSYNFGTDAASLAFDAQEVVVGAAYAPNTLSVSITNDENDNQSFVYKNMEGQVVLTRSIYPARNNNGEAAITQNTYYVYDDFGQVRCVIPPKAEDLLNPSTSFKPFELFGSGFKYKLIFAFDYDIRGRVNKKKSADVDVLEEMLYNTRDELELVKTRSGKWMRMTYDDLGRSKATFLYTGAGTPAIGSTASMDKLTENFYDNYTYPEVNAYRTENEYPSSYNSNPKGKLTGTWVKYIGDGVNSSYSYRPGSDYYDEYGRLIQASSRNHKGGKDYLLYKLDFTGRVIRNLLIADGIGEVARVEKSYSYNKSGKINSVCQKTGMGNDAKAYWEPVARYAYNVMGDLKSNTMGCKIQVADYAYNIKGWLTKINNINGLETGKDFFAMQLGYTGYPDNGTVTEQKWQVAQRKGKNTDPFALKQGKVYTDTYAYKNDYQLKSSVLAEDGNPIYTMNGLNYDIQGNIQHLSRTWRGTLVDDLNYTYATSSNQLQNVSEASNSQRQNPTGYEFFDDSKTPVGNTDNSYAYDASGNMTKDLNKGIKVGEIVYNFLNLPDKLKDNRYIYTADGDMVQMRTGNGKFDYIGGVVYKNDVIEQVPTANGRVLKPEAIKQNNSSPYVATPDTLNKNYWRYEYQLTDHLGNMRVACRCQEVPETEQTRYEKGYPPRVVQQAHYDPWGVKLPLYGNPDPYAGKPAERFLYNGKEYENALDLYNFGARMYDPTTGRWFVPDPIDQFSDFSPYGFVLNDPMNLTDPDGMQVPGKEIPWRPGFIEPSKILADGIAVPRLIGNVAPKLFTPNILSGAISGIVSNGISGMSKGAYISAPSDCHGCGFMWGQQRLEELRAKTWAYKPGDISAPGTSLGIAKSALEVTGDIIISEYVAAKSVQAFRKFTPEINFLKKAEPFISKEVGIKLLPQGWVPNAGGNIVSFTTTETETYFRVYSNNPNGGGFLTKVAPKSSSIAREGLSLPPSNTATFIQEVTVPSGVILQRSRALPAFGGRGGLEQFQILNYDPRIIFHQGIPLK